MLFLFKLKKKRVLIKKGISIFAAPSIVRGKGSILRYGTFIRKAKIPQKYLDKLREKCRNFQLTEFSEYRFERNRIYSWLTSNQHASRYYLWPSYNDAIFKSVNDDDNPDKYNKWLESTYNVFNRDSEKNPERIELEDLLDKNVKLKN